MRDLEDLLFLQSNKQGKKKLNSFKNLKLYEFGREGGLSERSRHFLSGSILTDG